MNKQIELFNQLVELVKTNEAFYKQEFKLGNSTYWIFNYRLATYTDFLAPGALWCRGTMFEVTQNGDFMRLASLPMPKFFNLGEVFPLRLNTLGEQLVEQGRLSKDVFERAKAKYNATLIENR